MYTTKQVLPAHGRLTLKVEFTHKNGTKYIQMGSSQSYNVDREQKILFNDALFNAFYALAYHLGVIITEKYDDDTVNQMFSKVKILNYIFDYYEDRIYSYKRVIVKEKGKGTYKTMIRRKDKVHAYVDNKTVTKGRIAQHEDTFL